MRAKEVHRVRFETEPDGLVIVNDVLGERHGGRRAGSCSAPSLGPRHK